MIRFSGIVLFAGVLAAAPVQAAQDGNDVGRLTSVQQIPAQQIPVQQSPAPQAMLPDVMLDRQILQTLTDIRDSQLAMLQTELKILATVQSQPVPSKQPHHAGHPAAHKHLADRK